MKGTVEPFSPVDQRSEEGMHVTGEFMQRSIESPLFKDIKIKPRFHCITKDVEVYRA